MKTTIVTYVSGGLIALAAASIAGTAAAQANPGYEGYQGYKPPATNQMPGIPPIPKIAPVPKPPEFKEQPRFKPFKGEHVDSAGTGIDPYPKPKKPKGGFSTYDGH